MFLEYNGYYVEYLDTKCKFIVYNRIMYKYPMLFRSVKEAKRFIETL
jgi:hypothetical protein